VQVDESCIGRPKKASPKCKQPRQAGELWIVAAHSIDRDVYRSVGLPMIHRTKEAIQPFVLKHCLGKRTSVSTDCFSSYSGLETHVDLHQVNHDKEWVTADGHHTNAAEGAGSVAKNMMRSCFGLFGRTSSSAGARAQLALSLNATGDEVGRLRRVCELLRDNLERMPAELPEYTSDKPPKKAGRKTLDPAEKQAREATKALRAENSTAAQTTKRRRQEAASSRTGKYIQLVFASSHWFVCISTGTGNIEVWDSAWTAVAGNTRSTVLNKVKNLVQGLRHVHPDGGLQATEGRGGLRGVRHQLCRQQAGWSFHRVHPGHLARNIRPTALKQDNRGVVRTSHVSSSQSTSLGFRFEYGKTSAASAGSARTRGRPSR
jgi:PAS domain-containing protein